MWSGCCSTTFAQIELLLSENSALRSQVDRYFAEQPTPTKPLVPAAPGSQERLAATRDVADKVKVTRVRTDRLPDGWNKDKRNEIARTLLLNYSHLAALLNESRDLKEAFEKAKAGLPPAQAEVKRPPAVDEPKVTRPLHSDPGQLTRPASMLDIKEADARGDSLQSSPSPDSVGAAGTTRQLVAAVLRFSRFTPTEEEVFWREAESRAALESQVAT